MHPNLIIAIQLQQEQGVGTAGEIPDRRRRALFGSALQGQPPQPAGVFDQLMVGAVRRVKRKTPHSGH